MICSICVELEDFGGRLDDEKDLSLCCSSRSESVCVDREVSFGSDMGQLERRAAPTSNVKVSAQSEHVWNNYVSTSDWLWYW